ncbi:NAD(P)-binding protein [Coniochaeta ligniaria NRRL 30616]|uniref:NAD(P)-binding protein n=1 Tax=Coniochaeta ligniaria NRRL 30616 TaxID=1408157 RepID=A0A1J7IHZ0_9PEZI|nr:NAD(P)-binding protein [Coniochaeta ligniaria NRRL 30616]
MPRAEMQPSPLSLVASSNYFFYTSTYNRKRAGVSVIAALTLIYLAWVNHILQGVPSEAWKLSGSRWTAKQLKRVYRALDQQPIEYTSKLPPRLDRGNGLVGGFIVLQLLARGTPPADIRILDIRSPERRDMAEGLAKAVEFVQTDITSAAAVDAAFARPWHLSVTHLPLTVFHTPVVILASDRSTYLYGFLEAVNVNGTKHVLAAARSFGADIFSSTSSASISIRPVEPFVTAGEPRNFWQILDERDFSHPLRPRAEFFGNYPASKAVAERLVCAASNPSFRTGCIRPANGVYGNPTDNTVGGPLSRWVPHIVQSFVHGANVAIAHLHHEAVLLNKDAPQAGRPFVVTDPNPPISYIDLYAAISTLSVHPFRTVTIPPILIVLLSYAVEWYHLLPYRVPFLKEILPEIRGDLRHLQPGIISICTHLIGSDADARQAVGKGLYRLGYSGVVTTLEEMVLEILEWNREHEAEDGVVREKKLYTTSTSLAEQLRQVLAVGRVVAE